MYGCSCSPLLSPPALALALSLSSNHSISSNIYTPYPPSSSTYAQPLQHPYAPTLIIFELRSYRWIHAAQVETHTPQDASGRP